MQSFMLRCSEQHVFCIGLCETGTPELAEALGALGMAVRTDPPLDLMLGGQFPEAAEGYLGLAGPSAAAMFRELDLAFPDSKFILTLRTPHEWLEAIAHRSHTLGLSDAPARLYGGGSFDRVSMLATYELHKAAVLAHFVGREDDLLLIDLFGGENWDVLCPFLRVRPPRRAFPRLERHLPGSMPMAA